MKGVKEKGDGATRKGLSVCYFGIFNTRAARNRILLKGLRENDIKVIECLSDGGGVFSMCSLVVRFFKIRKSVDIVLVGYPGHKSVFLAKLLTRKPVVFDAFFSLYDSAVHDRGNVRQGSMRARMLWLLDRLSCRFADLVLLDTETHIDYFVEEFGVRRDTFCAVPIGADDTLFYPGPERKKETDTFVVEFHGAFIPLQGTEYIVEAAHKLRGENIQFVLVGDGQTEKRTHDLAKELAVDNIRFVGRVAQDEVLQHVRDADVVLGIFGNTPKAARVIPNKVYEGLASRVAVVTGDSPAIHELFHNREHLLLCGLANSDELARAIVELRDDTKLLNKLAESGYQRYLEIGTPQKVAAKLTECLLSIKR